MLEYFTTSVADNRIVVINKNREYTFNELKGIISYRIQQIQSKNKNVVICGDDNFSFIINFFSSLFANKNIYLLADSARLNELNFNFELLNNFDHISFSNVDVFNSFNPRDRIINFYTSGSSGTPKLIKKSLYNLLEEAKDIFNTFTPKKDLTVFSTTTMCHLFGLTFHLMFPIVNGLKINTNPVVYPENLDNDNSILISSPAFLGLNIRHNLEFSKNPRFVISSGAKLDENIFDNLKNKSEVIEIYGSTETGIIGYKKDFNEQFRLFENVNIISDDNETEVQSNYIYDKKVRINDKVKLNGRYFTILNRTDRLFKIQDKRVSAPELEMKLKQHEYIEEAYITKINEKLVTLCALSKAGMDFLLSENIAELTKVLKKYLFKYTKIVPQRWKFIDELPKNKMGKFDTKFINHIFSVNISLPVILDRVEKENEITYKIFMYKNCNFFNGHFPKQNLVPGVFQMYLAKEMATKHFNLNLKKGQLKRIKFANIIFPDSIVNLKLTNLDNQVSYEYYSDKQKYSSGVFVET